jgi:hypothetical protein
LYDLGSDIRRGLLESERGWFKSKTDLYSFAIQNHRYFHAGKEQVIVSDPEVLDEFNKKIDRSNELRKQYQTALQSFKKNQRSTVADLGVSERDFGLNP